jgi:hypothetical protein
MDYDRKYNLKFNKLIILNLDGYGSISKNLTILEGHSISDLEGNASLNWIPMGLGLVACPNSRIPSVVNLIEFKIYPFPLLIVNMHSQSGPISPIFIQEIL